MVSDKIERRRRRVRRLNAQGATTAEMARQLDVSKRTIRRDRNAIKEQIGELRGEQADGLIFDIKSSFDTLNEEAWTRYHQEDNPTVKLGALKIILNLQKRKLDVYQELGLLDKVAEKYEVDITEHGFNFEVVEIDVEEDEELIELMGGTTLEDELVLDGDEYES